MTIDDDDDDCPLLANWHF